MEKRLLKVVGELQRKGILLQKIQGTDTEQEDQFLSAVESLSEKDEHLLSDLAVDLYNEIVNRKQIEEEEASFQSFIQNSKEKEMSDEKEQEVMKQILNIFKRWEEGGFATVEVPEEVTGKELKGLFMTTFNEMPFQTKMDGAMDEEVYTLSQELLKKKSRKSRTKVSEKDKKAIASHLKEMVEVTNLVNNYLESPVSLNDIESVSMTETQVLEILFDLLTEENFCEVAKEEKVSRLIRKLCIDRKISTVVVKGKKRSRVQKKWNGEGEPFNELTPSKEPSMTFAIWKKILSKDIKLSALNKWATKEFGTKKDGEPRDVSRVLVKMKKKVVDFYKIDIGEVVSVSKVG